MMDYQVWIVSKNLPPPCSSFLQTSLQQDIYNKSCLLIVSPSHHTFLSYSVADKQIGVNGSRPLGPDVSHPGC